MIINFFSMGIFSIRYYFFFFFIWTCFFVDFLGGGGVLQFVKEAYLFRPIFFIANLFIFYSLLPQNPSLVLCQQSSCTNNAPILQFIYWLCWPVKIQIKLGVLCCCYAALCICLSPSKTEAGGLFYFIFFITFSLSQQQLTI